MFEARMEQAEILKKVLDAVKELVTDANFDCSDEGIKLQAMDNSHVALVSLLLSPSGFQDFRCDRNMSLGMNIASLQKIIKCAGNDDVVTLRADQDQDVLGLLFENKKHDRVGEYEMKLMDIDQEHLGIPDTMYDAEISLPAAEFARIIRDLKELGESVKIEVSKDGVRFSAEGDIGSASVTLKQTEDKAGSDSDEEEDREEEDDAEEEEEEEDAEEQHSEEEDVKVAPDVKPAKKSLDAIEIDGEEDDAKPAVENGGEDAKPAITIDEDEDEDEPVRANTKVKKEKEATKKRAATASESPKKKPKKEKAAPAKKKEKAPAKKKAAPVKKDAKKAKASAEEKDGPRKITIQLSQAVNLTFSIKYLSNFAKSTPLSDYVHLHMSNEVPLLVAYPFAQGHIRYYLAPKISED